MCPSIVTLSQEPSTTSGTHFYTHYTGMILSCHHQETRPQKSLECMQSGSICKEVAEDLPHWDVTKDKKKDENSILLEKKNVLSYTVHRGNEMTSNKGLRLLKAEYSQATSNFKGSHQWPPLYFFQYMFLFSKACLYLTEKVFVLYCAAAGIIRQRPACRLRCCVPLEPNRH